MSPWQDLANIIRDEVVQENNENIPVAFIPAVAFATPDIFDTSAEKVKPS